MEYCSDFWSGVHILCMWPGELVGDVKTVPYYPNVTDDSSMVLYLKVEGVPEQPIVHGDLPFVHRYCT